ncbi:Uncharacterised protein [Vibrio cholerae]|nr:Uncharacterised protein [Vibrio cholerae]
MFFPPRLIRMKLNKDKQYEDCTYGATHSGNGNRSGLSPLAHSFNDFHVCRLWRVLSHT